MVVRVPHAMSSGLSASMAEVAAMSDSALRKRFRSSCESSPSVSPPNLPLRKRYRRTVSEDAEDEGPTTKDEDPATEDEGHTARVESPGMDESRVDGLDDEVMVGMMRVVGSGSAPVSERPKRVSAFRQPTLTTWTGQRMWTSGSLPISPSPSNDPSTISSPMTPLIVPSPVCYTAAIGDDGFSDGVGELKYDRDIGELFARLGAVKEEIFSQRPVLALEAWTGQTDAQRAALWHAISDVQGENQDLRLQLAEERRARLELSEVVDGMRRGQEPRGGA
ncbi:hypothetical protein Tco_0588755 [Tanacetum coccineum]